VVPHRGTNWAVLWLTLQIGRDAVLSESYGRGCRYVLVTSYKEQQEPTLKWKDTKQRNDQADGSISQDTSLLISNAV
jgi:hypothetical protein